jgi:hypothetical protein
MPESDKASSATLLGVFLQTAMDHALQARRGCLGYPRNGGRIFVQNRRHRIGRRGSLERARTGQHLVENRTERKDVGPVVDINPTYLLRRHVALRAHHDTWLGRVGHGRCCLRLRLDQLSQAEV